MWSSWPAAAPTRQLLDVAGIAEHLDEHADGRAGPGEHQRLGQPAVVDVGTFVTASGTFRATGAESARREAPPLYGAATSWRGALGCCRSTAGVPRAVTMA